MSFINQEKQAISDLYQHQFEYTNTSFVVYKGDADPGRAVSATGWRISKFTYDANWNVTGIQWASGTADFQFVWNDRANYTYS